MSALLVAGLLEGCDRPKNETTLQGAPLSRTLETLPRSITTVVNVDICGRPHNVVRVPISKYSVLTEPADRLSKVFAESLHTVHMRDSLHAIPRSFQQRRVPPPDLPRRGGNPGELSVSHASMFSWLSLASLFQGPQPGARTPQFQPPEYRLIDSAHNVSQHYIDVTSLSIGRPVLTAADSALICNPTRPEFQDDQPLINADTTYGPLVQIISSPVNDTLKNAGQFENKYQWVASVIVTIDSVENTYARLKSLPRYQALQLDSGYNCVYLGRFAGNWRARVKMPGAKGCNQPVTSGPDIVAFAGPELASDSIPPATRIIEGPGMVPYFGVRCGRAWCTIGARSKHDLAPPSFANAFHLPHAPPVTSRSKLDAWFDEQTVAVLDPVTNKLKPGMRAAVIPDSGLLNRKSADYYKGPVLVSYVFWPADPPEKYKKKFGFAEGWNQVYMQHIQHQPDTVWRATIIDAGDNRKMLDITNYPHVSGEVRGGARWAFWPTDDWIWAPCDNGCCLVEEGRN
jgi:hypothetical protein